MNFPRQLISNPWPGRIKRRHQVGRFQQHLEGKIGGHTSGTGQVANGKAFAVEGGFLLAIYRRQDVLRGATERGPLP
jgi:hypothetical protein